MSQSAATGELTDTGEPNTGEPTDKATEDLENAETEAVAAEERDLIESQEARRLLEGETVDGTTFELL